ncbi:tyrosine-protein phosphatase [Pseudonocardia kujensis]|uniref:tyrosine-protein phosphatase n=1 Tax=Pseudonocardia kujensis TaxID=1128675 RepID=UPI001E5FF115|nr:tyrosine-protein phosphatase [Pseudonocardia kujensis]MCE0761965.1 tyrosine-protein phosphatase [Pseudonocardia kujensis]
MDETAAWDVRSTHRPVGATTNLRDLGGTPTEDGRAVLSGRVYRAEALVAPGTTTRCTAWLPEHTDAYRALGVRTVLDLRSAGEAERIASSWPEATGADYVALPIEEGGEGDTDYVREIRTGVRTGFTAADMAGYYALTLRRRTVEFGAGLRILADPGRHPVLIHCAAGKDRTGLLVALLLEALGVAREVVVADYALTGVLRPDRVQAYADLFEGIDLAAVATLFDSPAAAMEEALTGLDVECGSVTGFLVDRCGVTWSEIDSLRANLLSPS